MNVQTHTHAKQTTGHHAGSMSMFVIDQHGRAWRSSQAGAMHP